MLTMLYSNINFNVCIFINIVSIANLHAQTTTINLGGEWTLFNSTMEGIPAMVPGGVHTALMENGLIGDPYYRKNDENYRWVGRCDWTYITKFTVSAEILSHTNVLLVCQGLDTVSNISINGQIVGQSDNMFVRYIFNIKSALKVGENAISVNFTSAVKYAKKRADELGYRIPPECPLSINHGECHVNKIRKMQCAFSWDWGPSFATHGIWKNMTIEAFDDAIITDVTTETLRAKKGAWTLQVAVYMKFRTDTLLEGIIRVELEDTPVTFKENVALVGKHNSVTLLHEIPKVVGIKPWWPRGYGDQRLYTLHVFFYDRSGTLTSHKSVRIGFRTVELVQDPVSRSKYDGKTFYFRVNGQPIFLKGSNWIPADSFPERVTRERLYNYLKSAADVHMNSMRVWGGGVYESDEFYDMTDELGILVWQDFMFACALYPVDDTFMTSVRQEVTYQVRRLKHHPSILAYSGNNENEVGLSNGWWIRSKRYIDDYVKLYIDTIYKIVKAEDPTRPYMSSSPSNGVQTEQDGWISKSDPGGVKYGDIHDYQYSRPFFKDDTYHIPRMASEFGLESLPSLESLESVYDEDDLDYESDLNNYRQHHGGGNYQMLNLIQMYMNTPNSTDPRRRFEDIVYCTQIVQAVAMRTETEHYRRWQSSLNGYKEGHTMGALYWMLADIWQAPSWASLEYGGKWKMLHYFAKHFFAPTLISPIVKNDVLDVFIVIDEIPTYKYRDPLDIRLHIRPEEDLRPLSMFPLRSWKKTPIELLKGNLEGENSMSTLAGSLYMKIYSWDSFEPLHTWEIPFQLIKTAQSVHKVPISDLLQEAGCDRAERCLLFFHLGDPNSGLTTWLPLSTFTDTIGIQKAHIQVTKVENSDEHGEFLITIRTDNVAPYVWLEAYGVKGRFSDNGFLLNTNVKQLVFYAWGDCNVDTLKQSLKIKSLLDVYF